MAVTFPSPARQALSTPARATWMLEIMVLATVERSLFLRLVTLRQAPSYRGLGSQGIVGRLALRAVVVPLTPQQVLSTLLLIAMVERSLFLLLAILLQAPSHHVLLLMAIV